MLLLVFGEVTDYMSKKTVTDVYADTTNDGKLRINFDVYFHEVSCEHLSVDVLDVIGNLKSNVTASVKKLAKKTTNEFVQRDGSVGGTGKTRTSWLSRGFFSGATLKEESQEERRALQAVEPHYHGDHVLKSGEESDFVKEWENLHPDLVEWYKGMGVFKNLIDHDKELIKSAMALTLSWEQDNYDDDPDQKKTVYKGGKQASFDVTSMEEIKDLADEYNILLVDFHAPWCSHCQKFSPTWEKLAYYFNTALHAMEEVYTGKTGDWTKAPAAIDLQTPGKKMENLPKGKVLVANVNCVQYPKVCKEHKIMGYPAIRIYKNHAAHHHSTHETHINMLTEYTAYSGGRSISEMVKFGLTSISEFYPKRKDFVSLLISEEGDMPHKDEDAHPSVVSNVPVLKPMEASTRSMSERHTMEGCRITGYADSSRVPGVVRFSVTDEKGATDFDPNVLNMTHEVKSFWFGAHKLEPHMDEYLLKYNQGSPFERSLKLVDDYKQLHVAQKRKLSYQHYIKTVATSMLWQGSTQSFTAYEMSVNTNQFTDPPDRTTFPSAMPSVVFHYDLSPLQILIREEKETFFRFMVNLCAIVGGVFTVASMIDGVIHRLSDVGHKMQIGKAG
ncbi:protein disulfide isomerase [Chloropicon primus]|uniref:Protein disulfide isomerase n=1 Tax=Chloropicon primus TaxID=1764295 RepID=A0A5B8MX87_9CHLO|nr:protein disulfide isomerase [Chloropicon primus]UPR04404.1 protein disulfide isomerase [Chloropicon primus]|eukprot:QDZ25199.1 protein disulfide isomerase [Chloropicon primus]